MTCRKSTLEEGGAEVLIKDISPKAAKMCRVLFKGAIQIICDTQCHIHSGTVSPNDIRGRGFANVSRDIFSKIFEDYFCILCFFQRFSEHYFWKN